MRIPNRFISVIAGTATVAGALLAVGSPAAQAAASTTAAQAGLTSTVTGASVTATATMTATPAQTLLKLGVTAWQSDYNARIGFPSQTNVPVTTAGSSMQTTRTFTPGVWNYTTWWQDAAGIWGQGTTKSFFVPAPATTPTTMPVGNLPGWTQTMAQDFNTPAAPGQVANVYGSNMVGFAGSDTSGNGAYTPDKVLSVHDGVLDYYVHTENGVHMVACPQPLGYTGQTYGRFSLRFKSDALPGYKSALLLWPADNNWSEGELDYSESNLSTGSHIAGYVHRLGTGASDNAYAVDSGVDQANTGWHIITIDWTPGSAKYILDGQTILSATTNIPTTAHRWSLQLESQLSTTAPADSVSGHYQIDWMTAYNYTP